MSSDPNNQAQYPPPQWENHPQRGAYPIAQQAVNYRQPPPPQPSQQPYPNPPGSAPAPVPPGEMVTLPPPQHQQQQDFYRHPPQYDMYPGHPQDPMRGPPPPHLYQSQPAPRQRTAIACRYCRRRKIRCSGFDASEDGRCTNCQRFQQECIFTPVSSQAQAFVPAHTAYPHLRNAAPMQPQRGGRALYPQPGTQIYGAHGQPLGTMPPHDPYQHQPPPPGYPMQSPPGPYQGQVYDDRGPSQPPHPHDKVSRKRPRTDDTHPAVPPPRPPQIPSSHQDQGRPPPSSGRRSSGGTGGYEYPDPTPLVPVSPVSSTTSYASAPYHQPQQQPYYASQPSQSARRSSPGNSAYSYGEARASGSPHGSTSSSSAPGYGYPGGLHPPQVLPDQTGRTPPPQQREGSNNGSGQRGGMAVRDLLGPGNADQGGRSSADADMLKALNKRGM